MTEGAPARRLVTLARLGTWSWSCVGVVVAATIVVVTLAAVSELVLPLVFAAVLAVLSRPSVGALGRRGLRPSADVADRAQPALRSGLD